MKKLKGVVLATILSALVFAGCSQSIVEDAVVAPSETNTTTEVGTAERTLKITATTEDGVINFSNTNSNARTILPATITNASDLWFYLGIRKKGSTMTFDSIEFSASDTDSYKGTVSKTNLELTSYDFKLYAVPKTSTSGSTVEKFTGSNLTETNIKNAAVFVGYASADMRYDTSVSFYLTSNSLTGTGGLSVNITTAWKVPAGYNISVGLYAIDTNTLIYPGTITPTASSDTELSISNWGSDSIKVGTYNLVIKFTQTAGKQKSYVYSEKVVILQNRTSTGDIEVPEIIAYKPTKPKDLIVLYQNPNNSEDTYYNVQFAWTDTSYCETGFKFELIQLSTTGFPVVPASDTEWDAATSESPSSTNEKYLQFDNDDNPITSYIHFVTGIERSTDSTKAGTDNGNLNMNNDHLTLQLPLETRYAARICATNDEGDSDWTYCELDQTTTDGISKDDTWDNTTCKVTTSARSYADSAYKAWDSDVKTINRYRIKYNLVGGTFVNAADKTTTNMPNTVVYESQHTDTSTSTPAAVSGKVAILKPNSKAATTTPVADAVTVSTNTYLDTDGVEQTGKYLQLTYNSSYWKYWAVDSVTGTAYDVTATTVSGTSYDIPNDYTDYKNLNLFAVYDVKTTEDLTGTVTIDNVNAYVLKNTDITVDFKLSGGSVTNTVDGITGASTPSQAETLAKLSGTVEFTEGTVDSITIAKSSTLTTSYSIMNLKIISCSTGQTLMDQNMTSGSTSWDVSIGNSNYSIGKYLVTVTAYSSAVSNVPYTQQFTFSIIGSSSY